VYSDYDPDDGQRNCPKHVQFHVQNKFVKLGDLVGFIIKKIVYVSYNIASDMDTFWHHIVGYRQSNGGICVVNLAEFFSKNNFLMFIAYQ